MPIARFPYYSIEKFVEEIDPDGDYSIETALSLFLRENVVFLKTFEIGYYHFLFESKEAITKLRMSI